MLAVTLILLQVLYADVYSKISILPRTPTCGIYGHVTFKFENVPNTYELDEIYISTRQAQTRFLFRRKYSNKISRDEGNILYWNNTDAKLINIYPELNGIKLEFKFKNDKTSDVEVVALEALKIKPFIEKPINEDELKQYGYSILSVPEATLSTDLKIQIYDKDSQYPVNFVSVRSSSLQELPIIELKSLITGDIIVEEMILNYDEKKNVLSFPSEYYKIFPRATILFIRNHIGVYQVSTTNQIYKANPFTRVVRTKENIKWNLKNGIESPLIMEIYLYISRDSFIISHIFTCSNLSKCIMTLYGKDILIGASTTSFTLKKNLEFNATHLRWYLVDQNGVGGGYTRTVKIYNDSDPNDDPELSKSNGISKKTILLIVIPLVLLILIIAVVTTLLVMRRKKRFPVSK